MHIFTELLQVLKIDLVITESGRPLICCEIKFSLTLALNKGFWNAFDDLKCNKAFIIYPGEDVYFINEKVQVIPFTKLDMIFNV